jgi:exosortase A-associated hydrolase 1
MNYQEIPVVFECAGYRLIGIVCLPETPTASGVLIVVGGPQYRSGSHRQFTLLARDLACQGIASFRFDYRGMGDSEGDMRTFEQVNDDVRAALDCFLAHAPSLRRIALWGLCDAASAALYYANTGDSRIGGLVLLNPWVHSVQGEQQARLKHYYLKRIADPSFWHKLFSGGVTLSASVMDLLDAIKAVLAGSRQNANCADGKPFQETPLSYIDRMLAGLSGFQGPVLIVLSGNDLVSQEFQHLANSHPGWKAACLPPKVEKHTLAEANHTFSSHTWRALASDLTAQWLKRRLEA